MGEAKKERREERKLRCTTKKNLRKAGVARVHHFLIYLKVKVLVVCSLGDEMLYRSKCKFSLFIYFIMTMSYDTSPLRHSGDVCVCMCVCVFIPVGKF